MEKQIKNYLEEYDVVSDEIKFISNSLIRLKILNSLFYNPHSMKEINEETGLCYSSLSSNIHGLEVKGYVYRELNKYYLNNIMKFYLREIIDLDKVLNFIDSSFNLLIDHNVDMISEESIKDLYLLDDVKLIETNQQDVYKTYNIFKELLDNANYIKGIFPYYHLNFPSVLNQIINKNIKIDIVFPKDILNTILEEINFKKPNVSIATINNNLNILLLSTDKAMALGLFRNQNQFDQNRLLISSSINGVKWGNNLFENFKKENKIEYSYL